MKKLLTFVMLFCTIATCWAAKKENLEITVNGQKRSMIVYSPAKPVENMPLMIVTHGMNQSPEYQSVGDDGKGGDRIWEMCDTAKFVVTYLRSDGSTWDTGGDKDMNFVSQTITEMKNKFGIDETRVYWSGFSMGSMLIYHCMAKMAKKIAAFAPTSGIQFSESPWSALKSGNLKINLIAHHSNGDTVFPINQYDVKSYVTNIANNTGCTKYTSTASYTSKEGNYKGLKEVWVNPSTGNEVELFMYDGGGHWPSYYNRKEIWNFCKRFQLDTPLSTYQKTYNRAKEIVEYWANDPGVNTKSAYKTLKSYLTSKGPDAVDQTSDSKLKTATTSLNTAITNFETAAKTAVKTSPEVTITEFDPNLHIYLCFGQSNMEGNATPELEDYAIQSDRFLTMAAVNMTTHKRTKGHWYMARPPLCRDNTGLTPADYFGRKMVEQLPDSIKVGVINVAIGGASIDAFDDDKCEAYIAKEADWFKSYCANYDNHPYQRLIAMAKEAQKVGVIKGILLHQGCTDNGSATWCSRVKLIYDRMINDLGLDPEDTPLLAGELLSQANGGVCYGHNTRIAELSKYIPNAHKVSSTGCPGASDGLHFTVEGYRKIGTNYATVMMNLLTPYLPKSDLNITSLKFESDTLSMQAGVSQRFKVLGVQEDGKEIEVNANCVMTSENEELISFTCPIHANAGCQEGTTKITATLTDSTGVSLSASAIAKVELFSLGSSFQPSILKTGSFSVNSNGIGTFKSQNGGFGGWHYSKGIDLSGYHYLFAQLNRSSLSKPSVRLYDVDDPNSEVYAEVLFDGQKELLIDLTQLQRNDGSAIDLSHIYYVGFGVKGTSSVSIAKVMVTNSDDPTDVGCIAITSGKQEQWYDLSGRPIKGNTRGLHISKGKKMLVK